MGKKVYVIDDDPDMVKVMSFRLKSAGFEVSTFTSGEKGLKQIESSPPDLILLDIQIPDMSGKEIAEALEKNENTKNIPIIFLTGKTDFDASIAKKAKRDMILKPCNFDELISKINSLTS